MAVGFLRKKGTPRIINHYADCIPEVLLYPRPAPPRENTRIFLSKHAYLLSKTPVCFNEDTRMFSESRL